STRAQPWVGTGRRVRRMLTSLASRERYSRSNAPGSRPSSCASSGSGSCGATSTSPSPGASASSAPKTTPWRTACGIVRTSSTISASSCAHAHVCASSCAAPCCGGSVISIGSAAMLVLLVVARAPGGVLGLRAGGADDRAGGRRSGRHGERARGATLGVGHGVRDERVGPGPGEGERDDPALGGQQAEHLAAARRPGGERVRALVEHRVELPADDVERARAVRPGVEHPHAHALADAGRERVVPVLVRVAVEREEVGLRGGDLRDRKSTRLNSSHVKISYAVFCLKKKKTNT